ncbi:unnamed protein product [marine sediment metagenome]|uniref:Uncharacterized protein n=2 Tax=marine sediment metagenome TaxID=412755 RepID=X1DNB9_9ZZZZ
MLIEEKTDKCFTSLMALYELDDLPKFIQLGGHVQDWLNIHEGILPARGRSIAPNSSVKRSIAPFLAPNYSVRLYVDVKAWRPLGWNLPSNGVAYGQCGHLWPDEGQGCLRVENHPEGKVYVRLIAATCFRASCPVCYQKWAAREAGHIEDKFKRLSRNNAEAAVPGYGRPVHAVISVPEIDAFLIYNNFDVLRDKINAIATAAGIKGACVIFHPYANEKMHEETPEKILIDESTGDFDLDSLREYYSKMNKHINFWYLRPHFHIIGYAPRDYDNPENDAFTPEKISSIYKETGYVVVNLGVRDSVRNTAHYQLSHAGVKKGFQTVTWIGDLSNRNYHKMNPLPKFNPKPRTCPECQAELAPVRWDPQAAISAQVFSVDNYSSADGLDLSEPGPSPLEGQREGGYWIDPGGWRYLNRGEKNHSCLVRKPSHR